jgi:hypothetical protein
MDLFGQFGWRVNPPIAAAPSDERILIVEVNDLGREVGGGFNVFELMSAGFSPELLGRIDCG